MFVVFDLPSHAVDGSDITCTLLQPTRSAWLAVDLGKAVQVSAVQLLLGQRLPNEWEVQMTNDPAVMGMTCISSWGVMQKTRVRSKTCAVDVDRTKYLAPCQVTSASNKAKLPIGRYVKVINLSEDAEMEVCDLKVYGMAQDPAHALPHTVQQVKHVGIDGLLKAHNGPWSKSAFVVRIMGEFTVPDAAKAGDYKFTLISSDGAMLFMNGKLLINNDGVHNAWLSASATILLRRGCHRLIILYMRQTTHNPKLTLMWEKKGFGMQFKKRTFTFPPKWAELVVAGVEGTKKICHLRAPAHNKGGVPIAWGSNQCHSSCRKCLPGTQDATACTECNSQTPFHTILQPKTRSGTCTAAFCPLCKPRECCGKGHRHFVLDAASNNGVCLRHTDDCTGHCVGIAEARTTCTKGCNHVLQVPTIFDELPSVLQLRKPVKGGLVDVVVCQVEKLVTCQKNPATISTHQHSMRAGRQLLNKVLPSWENTEEPPEPTKEYKFLASTKGHNRVEKTCTVQNNIQLVSACPALHTDEANTMMNAGGTCILDILDKLVCDKYKDGRCVTTEMGMYVCTVADKSPFNCPAISEYEKGFISCSCGDHRPPTCGATARTDPYLGSSTSTQTEGCKAVAITF
jgi:hypothetical protein